MMIEQSGRQAATYALFNNDVRFVVRDPKRRGGYTVLNTLELNKEQAHDQVVLVIGPPALVPIPQ
jgi:hypothetical protein